MWRCVMIVVEFEGVRHYTKPGWENHPARVRVDYGAWRPAMSTDGKTVEKWLLAKGFRCLNMVGRKHDGSSYREWWGLVGVFRTETYDTGVYKPLPPEVIRETFQAFRAQCERNAQ